MKSTILVAALMSSMAVAHGLDRSGHSLSNNGFDDNSWESVKPVLAATTTTTTRRFEPAVPAALTSVGLQQHDWNTVKALVTTTPAYVRAATTSSVAEPKAFTSTVSVEAVKNDHWKPWNTVYTTSVRLLTITSSSTYLEVKTITETLAVETSSTTSPAVLETTPVVYYETSAQIVASTTVLQIFNGQPPVNAQPPVNVAQPPVNNAQPPFNAAIQTPSPANPGLPIAPVQASTTTTPILFAQPSVVAAYTGTAAGFGSQLFLVLSVMVLGLIY